MSQVIRVSQVFFFLSPLPEWASIHLQLQELLGDEFECEKEVIYHTKDGIKIIGHVDAYHKPTDTVVHNT